MTFSAEVKLAINDWVLLDHPFYQAWSEGSLKMKSLKEYSTQYQKHVDAFPRYISATHSLCESHENRKVLLENLNDEEGLQGKPHPLLWAQFSSACGNDQDAIDSTKSCKSIQNIIDTFLSNARKSYEEGLASFYSYESQVPEVAETKIKGLKEHYKIDSPEALEFFEVHKAADIHHRKACEKLLDKIPSSKQQASILAAQTSAKSLWDFLSEMQKFDLGLSAS